MKARSHNLEVMAMSNYPSLRLVALLLRARLLQWDHLRLPPLLHTPQRPSPLSRCSIRTSSACSIKLMLIASRQTFKLSSLLEHATPVPTTAARPRESAPRAIGFKTGTSRFRGFRSGLFRGRWGTAAAEPRTLHNVIAWIPGSGHPNRLIVIGGHYDSRTTNGKDGVSPAPGANDSGSQTALVLEAARVMAGHVFDATVVFADWSGEEQGLRGSSFFVQHYLELFSKRHAGIELQLRYRRGRQHRKQRNDSSTVPPIFPRHAPRGCIHRRSDRLMIHHPPAGLCATLAIGAALMCPQ